MKILTFITDISLKGGGPSRSVPMLVKGLAEFGVDITLMTVRSDDMNIHALEGTNAKLKVLEAGYTQQELDEYLTAERFDIIQAQSMWDLRYHKLKKLADKYHIPYIITPRGMLEPWSLSQKKWKKKLALSLYQMKDLNYSACIYTTAEMEAQHIRKLGVKVPISVIPNGIDINGYPCRTSLDKVKKQILFLSRIHVKKGIELLIDVWKKIKNDYPDWSIKIVGNGEDDYIKQLKMKVEEANLSACIEILPPVYSEEKVDLYQTSALFVLPSYSENFGMVVAEALSCGVPVITSEYTPWNILNETKSGWCIPLSIETLEETLREALRRYPNELYEMGQKGSEMVATNFGYRSVVAKTVALYEWILNKGVKPDFVV